MVNTDRSTNLPGYNGTMNGFIADCGHWRVQKRENSFEKIWKLCINGVSASKNILFLLITCYFVDIPEMLTCDEREYMKRNRAGALHPSLIFVLDKSDIM